jgi:hypothetical protein
MDSLVVLPDKIVFVDFRILYFNVGNYRMIETIVIRPVKEFCHINRELFRIVEITLA